MALLRHVALWCRDMEKSRRFYEEVIGLKFVSYRPSGAGLDLSDGTNNITLLQYGNHERPVLGEGHEYIHLGILVDDLEDVWRRLRQWGAEFPSKTVKGRSHLDPNNVPSRAFKVHDPDGNILDVSDNREEWAGIDAGA